MRILLASYFYPPSIGGLERQSHLLARGLVQRGHSVHVLSARLAGFPQHELLDGVTVERLPAGRGSRWQKMATFLGALLVAAIRHRQDVDVVQVQQVLYPAAAIAAISPLLGKPIVVRNSGSGRFGGVQLMRRMPLGTLALWLIGARATCISLNDEMTYEMRAAGLTRTVQIPNGVDVPALKSAAERNAIRARIGFKGHVILWVGRFDPEKGVDVLIRAWQRAALEQATLVLVGNGVERSALEALTAEHEASARTIVFRGFVDHVEDFYWVADLFVLPSRSEGLSNALLEAMAHGLAVVATNVGGNVQVIPHSALGKLVSPNDPTALSLAIRDLLEQPDERARLGATARDHVLQHYSVEAMILEYERLYKHLARATVNRVASNSAAG
jgi:glycosyltransferase involved in cell wall biosynthesis